MQQIDEEASETGLASDSREPLGGLEQWGERASRFIEQALGYAFIAAVLLNFANVVDRYVLGRSIIGADEVEVFIMVGTTFLGAAVVTWRGRHLRMDVLARSFPQSIQAILRALEVAFFVAFVGIAAYESTIYAQQMFALGVISDSAHVPMWIPHGAAALGLSLMALAALVRGALVLRRGAASRNARRFDDRDIPS